MAAARRRALQMGSLGLVPFFLHWLVERRVCMLCRLGREMREDWEVIQRWRTEEKVLAKTMRWGG